MSQQKEEYNGWTNWETWNVNLWLTNDQSVYNEVRRVLMHPVGLTNPNGHEYEFQKEEWLKDVTYDLMHPEEGKPYITDDISLHRVNWAEIIGAFLEE